MILVCNFLRNDINSPNEYVRGSTLRFLCKLKEPELLEPLVPSVRANLEHRHSYVRRNAVLAIFSIAKLSDTLIPDAAELIVKYLSTEADTSCRRNALMMLYNCAPEQAGAFLSAAIDQDQVGGWGDILQLAAVEIIRKLARTNPSDRGKYMRCILKLLASSSTAVQYESAATLLSLSASHITVREATKTYVQLLVNESDNNIKMIVLDRLLDLKTHHDKLLQDMVMDILRALASPSLDIRRKTLAIALDLVTPRNIDEVVLTLKKEINKTQVKDADKEVADYRQLLIQTIHSCAVRFPEVANNVVHVLMEFLGDANASSASDVILFVREVVESYPALRKQILVKLLDYFRHIRASKVLRGALWILGEYTSEEDIASVTKVILEEVGSLPFLTEEEELAAAAQSAEEKAKKQQQEEKSKKGQKVLADGTYASQSAATESTRTAAHRETHLRKLLLAGDFFLGAVVVSTLVKLCLRAQHTISDPLERNAMAAEPLVLGACLLSLGESATVQSGIDTDSRDHILLSLRVLTEADDDLREIWVHDFHESFVSLLKETRTQTASLEANKPKKGVTAQPDELISVRQLRGKRAGPADLDDDLGADLTRATGNLDVSHTSALNRVFQLTGFSDPVYAEAVVNVHQYDIVLDVLIVNQTPETLQNLSLELATLGDLKLCERPPTLTIGPLDQRKIKANMKITSTETGIIFGTIVYDIAGQPGNADKNSVIMNEIHVDIMDYITPASNTDIAFRTMWAEFEWENKVAINTSITDPREYLEHVCKSTNMRCLTPESALQGDCGILAANLYARSIFGDFFFRSWAESN
eukprot:TRINITY_DN1979_c0_g1_i2.p1 TRINITY_DN1979_c0_g1~~TRINITY_DN1979_c0_g1_i2.p1  ORF type:complete len:932 (-),score=265.31 TRINITY_DN1979_c0_g1_i2:57-2510(-)